MGPSGAPHGGAGRGAGRPGEQRGESRWRLKGDGWEDLRASWAVWGLFGQSSRPWAVLGPSWGRLGSSWEPPVALFGLSWEPLGALLGHSWLSWGFIWPYWGSPGLSSTPLGQSWGPLGTTLETCAVDVDAVETQKADTLKMYVCSKDIGRFGFLGGPLGGLLGRLGSL